LINSDIITSDRFERLRILEFLWNAYRTATATNRGIENSPSISESLKIDQIRVESHLDILEDNGFVSVDFRTRGGWLVKIRCNGVTWIENFFIELEQEFQKSDDVEIKNNMNELIQENDLVKKYELRMQFLIVTGEAIKLVNTLLSKLGFGS